MLGLCLSSSMGACCDGAGANSADTEIHESVTDLTSPMADGPRVILGRETLRFGKPAVDDEVSTAPWAKAVAAAAVGAEPAVDNASAEERGPAASLPGVRPRAMEAAADVAPAAPAQQSGGTRVVLLPPLPEDVGDDNDKGKGGCKTVKSTRSAATSAASGRSRDPEREARKNRLRRFLATEGFRAVNEPRRSGITTFTRKFDFPLHAAVKAADLETVELLLWAGADRSKKDSRQATALDLARRLDRAGSHAEIIAALEDEEGDAPPGGGAATPAVSDP